MQVNQAPAEESHNPLEVQEEVLPVEEIPNRLEELKEAEDLREEAKANLKHQRVVTHQANRKPQRVVTHQANHKPLQVEAMIQQGTVNQQTSPQAANEQKQVQGLCSHPARTWKGNELQHKP